VNAYGTLISTKSKLVIRMLHFLFTDPSTGDGQAFFTMLQDFVSQYRDRAATTEAFQKIASEHFARTPIARNFGLKNLDWFFQQWVFEARLPSYQLEYSLEPGQNGQYVMNWTITQDNAGPNWFMPLPVTIKLPGGKKASTVVYVKGGKTSSKVTLPAKPSSIELDPDYWVLTEKTITKKMGER
jgi:aminopeptidase N